MQVRCSRCRAAAAASKGVAGGLAACCAERLARAAGAAQAQHTRRRVWGGPGQHSRQGMGWRGRGGSRGVGSSRALTCYRPRWPACGPRRSHARTPPRCLQQGAGPAAWGMISTWQPCEWGLPKGRQPSGWAWGTPRRRRDGGGTCGHMPAASGMRSGALLLERSSERGASLRQARGLAAACPCNVRVGLTREEEGDAELHAEGRRVGGVARVSAWGRGPPGAKRVMASPLVATYPCKAQSAAHTRVPPTCGMSCRALWSGWA